MKLAYQKLSKLQAWNETQEIRRKLRKGRSEQFKSNLFWFGQWVGSGRSGIFMYLVCAVVCLTGGLMWGMNTPRAISCPKQQSLCYLLRLNKTSVILPEQVKQVLKHYQRSFHQPRRRNSPTSP